MQDRISERLDEICADARSASTKNALHACRPGHPFNKDATVPFYNAWFVACQDRNICGDDLDWLRKQAEKRGEIAKFGDAFKTKTAAA